MIRFIKIKNFALIKDIEVEFEDGFNVIVGATGAGKSLIIKTLNFVLGARPNKIDIRSGQSKMFVQLVADSNNIVNELLKQSDIDLDEGEDLIIQRSYSIDGKSDIRINGNVVTLQLLKEISPYLVESYAQSEYVELLSPKNHIKILDSFICEEIVNDLKTVKDNNNLLNNLKKELSEIGGDSESRQREIDLLSYQIEEIQSANLFIGEDEEIKNKLRMMSSYEKISESIGNILKSLEVSLNEEIPANLSAFSSIAGFDDELSNLCDRYHSQYYEVKDIYETLKAYYGDMVFDQSEYDKLDARYEVIKNLKRKYGETIDDVLNKLAILNDRFELLANSDKHCEEINSKIDKVANEQYLLCQKISDIRKTFAKTFEKRLTEELIDVGIKHSEFKVNFKELPVFDKNITFTDMGLDNIEFMFAANMGQELKPLSKTASGGELSRLMLALKNVMLKKSLGCSIVFDEIDTGISGNVGYMVAKKIANISRKNQVICITHLPQVTAMADSYIKVDKIEVDGETISIVNKLQGDDIDTYIATMLGTGDATAASKTSAKELKSMAEEYKSGIKT